MARRILLLITDLEIGGTPTVVRELATRLHDTARGVHVEVVCLSKWGPVADQLRARGIDVTAFDARGARDLPRTVALLKRLVHDHSLDTVFSFLVHANVVAALASFGLRNVRFIQSVQTTQPEPTWHWTAQRFAAPRAESIVVPSPSVARVAAERSGIGPGKFVVIPNAIDVAPFEPLAGRRRVRAIDEPIRLGFLGRLDPVKQIDELIRTLALLGNRFDLLIFGDGAERARLEQLVTALDLSSRVKFFGTVASPVDALAQMDVLVLPSKAEGFGLVLIEAMAAGIPVVATNVDGIRDVVQDGVNGVLATSASSTDLSTALGRLVDLKSGVRTDLCGSVLTGGRRTVTERYTWDAVLPAYRRVLNIS